MYLHETSPISFQSQREGVGVFTTEQIRCLEEDTILLPLPYSQIKRKLSAAFTSQRSVSRSSASSASMSVDGFRPDIVHTFDIPIVEESIEVLEFIGFVAEAATVIYNRYLSRPHPDRNPDDLMAYVSGHISSLKLSQYDNMDPSEALRSIGLNSQIQEAITDPRFSHIFGTQPLYYWANDTVETNYAALLGRQRLLRNYANRRMTYKRKHNQAKQGTALSQEQGPSSPASAISATIDITPSDFQFPERRVILQSDIRMLDDHLSLYKGKAHPELRDEGEIIRNDGSANLSALATLPGGDFNSKSLAQYWSPKKETAEEYRLYAARRSPVADTCIVHIQVPLSFINRLHIENLWYSRNWKEYIWTCRKNLTLDRKFDLLKQADVVRGHVCSTISGRITRIPWENVQTHISESNVMRLPSGRKVTLWVFLQESTIDQLAEEIRGRIHFTIFEARHTHS